MTEKDLREYIRLKRERALLLLELEEFDCKRYSPPGANLSPFPPDHNEKDSFAVMADIHSRILNKISNIDSQIAIEYDKLKMLENIVSDIMLKKFITAAYIKGIPYGKIPKTLHIGRATVYRLRRQILSMAEAIK